MSEENAKSGYKVATTSKTQASYWKPRIFKFRRRVAGKDVEDSDYSVRIQLAGRREQFSLSTPNQRAAATKAAQIYTAIVRDGWEEALATYKPKESKTTSPTVGDLIRISRDLSSVRPETFASYAKALRKIAGDIARVDTTDRFDGRGGGRDRWAEKVDGIRLERIDGASLLKWKNRYLREHGQSKKGRASAAVTVNSLLRNAQALFSKKLRPFLAERIEIPAAMIEAFATVPREKEKGLRYQSKIDADAILEAAEQELAAPRGEGESEAQAAQRIEVYKALLLTLVFGLRRSEADMLLWDQFDLDAGILRIEDTEHKQLKSADSAGEIDIPAGLVPVLRGFLAGSSGEFVLESANPSHREGRSYRANLTFEHLVRWLRSQGVTERKPVHALRKEIGSMIASKQGIYAASRYLRHSDIRITARLYADKKAPVIPPLAMFSEEEGEVIEGDFTGDRKRRGARLPGGE